jgi:glycosyltransferase involved in cell wall biosynthesis
MKSLNKKVITKTIPEGVEKKFLQLERKNSKHILFLGRFDINQKGIDLLLNAYSKVENKIVYPLIIVGVGPDKDKIKNMIRDLKLQQRVKLIGPQYGKEKMKLLSEAIFVAIPSRSESFSLFTLEAIASGAPVVIFDIPGLSWVDDSVSLKTKLFDIDAYANNLLQMTDASLAMKKSENAKNFSKNFTWEKVTDDFEDFFKEVIKKENKND